MIAAAATLGAAIALSACGGAVKPTTPTSGGVSATRGRVDDPRTSKADRVKCLRQHRLPVREVGNTQLEIGTPPSGASVVFVPSPGTAQGDQIQGKVQGAEVIGSALLYPNQEPGDALQQIEICLSQGVSG